MEKIRKSAMELIGSTPLVELTNYEKKHQLKASVIAKLEYLNPAGSVKDRAALFMILDAEAAGTLKPGATIIEPTSGNTGIGIASIAAMKAEELRDEIPGSVIMGQFDNPANVKAHKETTGPEIWRDTDGTVDIFVAGVGTGGTITGTGEYLKSQKPDVKIVAVEPEGSPILSGGNPGPHGLQGIGAGFIPTILNQDIYDEIICVKDEDAYVTGREIAQNEGILVGISSSAAVWAAKELARRPENEGKRIVVLLPDTGDRYFSTPLFS